MSTDWSSRHQGVQDKMRWLTPNPNLPAGTPSLVSGMFFDMGKALLAHLKDGPQLVIGLQHLVDAKNAAVCQAIADSDE
jgi:hypothetical protein